MKGSRVNLTASLVSHLADGFASRRALCLAFGIRPGAVDEALATEVAAGRVIAEERPAEHRPNRSVFGYLLAGTADAKKRKTRHCLCCGGEFVSVGSMNRLCYRCRNQDISPYAP